MSDDLRKVDMSQWHEIGQLRKFFEQEGWATCIKLISGHDGVGRGYWRVWVAENYKPLDEKVYGPTNEVLAFAEVQEER